MVEEAEFYIQRDKLRRKKTKMLNIADTMAYQAEMVLHRDGDDLPAYSRGEIESKVASLRITLRGEDLDSDATWNAMEQLFALMQELAAGRELPAGSRLWWWRGFQLSRKPIHGETLN